MTLAAALTLTPTGPGTSAWDVPDGWQQGRGAFGGLVFALLATAARRARGVDDAALRTLTGEIPAAVVAGPAEVRTRLLRKGSSLVALAAEVHQGGDVVAHAVMSFGKTRHVDFDRSDVTATFPSYDETRAAPVGQLGPRFMQHFEIRPVSGVPFTGAEKAETSGWVRILEPGDVPAEIASIAMADAWYPTAMPVMRQPRPFGTISFALHVFGRGWRPTEPLFSRSRMVASQEGYFVELRELFTAKGELVTLNQQTFAIIK